jgi:hypothetical protein
MKHRALWLANHRDCRLYFCSKFPLWLSPLMRETNVTLPGTQLVMVTAFVVALLAPLFYFGPNYCII